MVYGRGSSCRARYCGRFVLQDEVEAKVQSHPAAVVFLVGFLALFGLVFALAGVDRMQTVADGEALVKLGIGLVVLLAAYRVFRYYRDPVFLLGAKTVQYRYFLKPALRVYYTDLHAAAHLAERLKRPPGTSVEPPVVHRLVLVDKAGKITSLLLPRYGAEAVELISGFKRLSGMEVSDVKDREELKAWLDSKSF